MTGRKLNLVVLSMVLLLGVAVCAHGRPGDIDAAFGDRGRVSTPYPPLVGREGNLSLMNFDGTAVTVIDANGKPTPGAAFAIPRTNGVRTVYEWAHDAEGGYLVAVTSDTAEGVQSGVMHLDAQGRLDTGFGVGGLAVVQDASRRIAEGLGGAYLPQPLLIQGIQVLQDGRVLLLESELPYLSCLKSWGLGVLPDFDACWGWLDGPVRYWMRRLQADGRTDESFGIGGRAWVGSIKGGVALFAARSDGSPIFVDGEGVIQPFAPDGSRSLGSRVNFFPTSGVTLPDGGVLLVGWRDETPNYVWVTRLDAQLQPLVAPGDVSGEIRLDLAGMYSGDTSGESATGIVRLSPDGRYAYFPANYVNTMESRSRCGGVARLRLDGTPVVDETFGRRGLVCLFSDMGNGVRVLPSGDLLLLDGFADQWSKSPSLHRLHAQDLSGPGYIRFTGAVYVNGYSGSVEEGAGTVTLRAKRMAGLAGSVSVEWRVIGTEGNPSVSGAQTGRLEWSDGDDADKTFTLALIDDQLPSPTRNNSPFYSSVTLALKAVDATPPNAVVSETAYQLVILDNDSPPMNVQFEAMEPQGGGGALGAWALLALLILLGARCQCGGFARVD